MKVEPLEPDRHQFRLFHSGRPSLDHYLHELAGYELSRRTAATFVLTDDDARVLGYYTLAHVQLELDEHARKNLPPQLPVTHLARLAVEEGSHGRGYSERLLMDALHRAWCASQEVPSDALVFDCDTVRLPLNSAFRRLPDQPRRAFITFREYESLIAPHSDFPLNQVRSLPRE